MVTIKYEDWVRVIMRHAAWLLPAIQLFIGSGQAVAFGVRSAPSITWLMGFAGSGVVAVYFRARSLGRLASLPGVSVSADSHMTEKVLVDVLGLFMAIAFTSMMLVDRPDRAFWSYLF